ncbi:MAG: dephospho-CoA kinase, partial [Gammaproteobacteria bacterium]|nr:dephospho-CoA kinase [Gammaproteobacteria bacterium]
MPYQKPSKQTQQQRPALHSKDGPLNSIPIIGLTGGIGSGKSTVCHLFSKRGIPIIDTDDVSRHVVEPGSQGLNGIIQLFGSSFLTPENTLNRAALRTHIFQNPIAKAQLEALLHPLI